MDDHSLPRTGVNVRTTFKTPFRYSTKLFALKPQCQEIDFKMTDVYGDGWNGAKIVVSIDGDVTEYSCTGPSVTETINIPEGTSRLLFTYVPGDWEGENLYTFTDPNGTVILKDGSETEVETTAPKLENNSIPVIESKLN